MARLAHNLFRLLLALTVLLLGTLVSFGCWVYFSDLHNWENFSLQPSSELQLKILDERPSQLQAPSDLGRNSPADIPSAPPPLPSIQPRLLDLITGGLSAVNRDNKCAPQEPGRYRDGRVEVQVDREIFYFVEESNPEDPWATDIVAVIPVPNRFISDFASVPSWAQWFLNSFGRYHAAAIVHDWMYAAGNKDRKETEKDFADHIFYVGLRSGGVDRVKAVLAYIAVRYFSKAFGTEEEWVCNFTDTDLNLLFPDQPWEGPSRTLLPQACLPDKDNIQWYSSARTLRKTETVFRNRQGKVWRDFENSPEFDRLPRYDLIKYFNPPPLSDPLACYEEISSRFSNGTFTTRSYSEVREMSGTSWLFERYSRFRNSRIFGLDAAHVTVILGQVSGSFSAELSSSSLVQSALEYRLQRERELMCFFLCENFGHILDEDQVILQSRLPRLSRVKAVCDRIELRKLSLDSDNSVLRRLEIEGLMPKQVCNDTFEDHEARKGPFGIYCELIEADIRNLLEATPYQKETIDGDVFWIGPPSFAEIIILGSTQAHMRCSFEFEGDDQRSLDQAGWIDTETGEPCGDELIIPRERWCGIEYPLSLSEPGWCRPLPASP